MHKFSTHVLVLIIFDHLCNYLVECGGDLGSIECVNGKWQADTKIISLLVVCPIQASWASVMCVFKRLGLYENGRVHEDFHLFLCSLFWKPDVIDHCMVEVTKCLNYYGGVGTLQLSFLPVGFCAWQTMHSKVNCTI